jgi:hypothetical protein
MKIIDLAQKHSVLFLVLFLALGCSIDLGNKRTGQKQDTQTKQKQSDDSDNERPTRPTTKTNGGVLQELVGKWCYLSNVQANDGGRMSEICITLNSDGTYEYYGETSSNNPYGGSGSQESDAGRWSATATTLTAHSNSGETKNFTLEKRNHPKTGDPMLIIDGDAFVTAYQKQPW